MAIKALIFLEEEELEQLRELAELRSCPPVVAKLVEEIDLWKEEA